MLVVADSSPLIALINIGHIEILPQLFGTVIIPPTVGAGFAGSYVYVNAAAEPAPEDVFKLRSPRKKYFVAVVFTGGH